MQGSGGEGETKQEDTKAVDAQSDKLEGALKQSF